MERFEEHGEKTFSLKVVMTWFREALRGGFLFFRGFPITKRPWVCELVILRGSSLFVSPHDLFFLPSVDSFGSVLW